MPNPTSTDVHVDRPLTNISIGFMQDAANFVADRVFPQVPVAKQSDVFFLYDRGDFFRDEMKKRAPSTESAGGGYKLSTASYQADVWALHKDIDDDVRGNFDDPLDPDRDAAIWLAQQALIRKDKDWVTSFFTTGIWGDDRTGVDSGPTGDQFLRWNVAASTPIKDIRRDVYLQMSLTGYKPNTLVLGAETWQVLQDNADFIDRIKYTQAGGAQVTPGLLSSLLEIDNVYIAAGVQNTAAENATDAFSFIAGKHALLVYAAPSPSVFQPSGGYTFSWTGRPGTSGLVASVSRMRMDWIKSDRIELEMAFDQKVVASAMGTFYSTAVA